VQFELSWLSVPTFLSPFVSQHLFDQGLAFLQVVFIDIVMAGDNAVAVGLAAAGLAPDKRRKAILFGLIGAVVTRIGFVLITVQLFQIIGLLLAGGLLLLWVCWKMWRELRHGEDHPDAPARPAKTLGAAVLQILIADISMSLDNVLAVTGAAEDHVWVLVFGLLFSIAMMGIAANAIASMLHRFQWIGYLGLLIVLIVALRMIWEGGQDIWQVSGCDASLKCLPSLQQALAERVMALIQRIANLLHIS
jgi:YjbE family integral membrane protein